VDGIINESTKVLKQKVSEKIRIETPIGSIESDSGNHFIDGLTVVILILLLFAIKNIWKR
jgi:hypothetical protein